jgi:hypothetical protein
MLKFMTRIGVVALASAALAACTTTGFGTGQALHGNTTATFSWVEHGGTQGDMVAHLSDGRIYQGRYFQITQESRIDSFGPLWAGWGGDWGWGGWGRGWGWGWGGWGPWGPYDDTITHYTGQILANLQGPTGFMRCHFTLARPSAGMIGGGLGQCQLPSGQIINAQFLRENARYQ